MQLPKATQLSKSFMCLEDNSFGELRPRGGRVVWVERYLAVGLAVTRHQGQTARSPFLSLQISSPYDNSWPRASTALKMVRCRVSGSIPDLLRFKVDLQPGFSHVFSAKGYRSLPRLTTMHRAHTV